MMETVLLNTSNGKSQSSIHKRIDHHMFKTNIKCEGCVAKVAIPLNEIVGEGNWSVDLKDPSKILFISKPVDELKLKTALEKVGYKAERI